MTSLHDRLCENSSWYRNWHNNTGHAVVHWIIMILFTAATSLSLSNIIDIKTAEAFDTPPASFSIKGSVPQLTTELLRSAKKYLNSSGSAQANALSEVTSIALERQRMLISSAKSNPSEVILNALPEKLISQMPESIISLLEREKTVEGTLTVNQVDYFTEKEEMEYTIEETSTGNKYNVHFDVEPRGLLTGAKVKARGVNIDKELVLALNGNSSNLQVSSTNEALVSGDERTLAILINFNDNTSQPFTTSDIISKVFTNPDSTNAYFYENSFGATTFSGTAVGWYTINVSSATCDYYTFASEGKKAAQAAGVSLTGYDRFLFIFPRISACSWAGMSNVGGNPSSSWSNGYNDSYVITHELGHALGMRHASSYSCGSQQIAPSCSQSEYGDPYDDMGGSWIHRHLAGSHKYQMGWGNTQTVTSSGTYTIYPHETEQSGTQILKIAKPDTGEAYYVEYRQPIGFDTSIPAEMANVSVTVWGGAQTKRLDMSPDGNFNYSSLSDGASFVDSINNITVTQVSHTPTSAVVQVTMSGPTCTRSKPTISLSPTSQSASAGQTLSYNLSIKNNDNSACPTTSFNLSSVVPTGFSSSLNSPTLSIAPGATAGAQLSIISTTGIADGSYAFTATASSTESIHQNSVNGTYLVFTPVADTIPPSVTIQAPTAGSKIPTNVTISATASDNVKVSKVDFIVDGVKVGTDTSSPYSLKWNSRKLTAGSHTVSAQAFDTAGNSSTHSVQVTK